MLYIIIIIVVFILLASIKQIDEYERGVKFSFGKYSKTLNPGWKIVLPIIQSFKKVDIRTKVVDVPEQDAITRDNVSIRINAVVYYKIFDASMAILNVENFYYAVSQLAQTTMRNAVGEVSLDELLSEREKISKKICEIIDKATDPWGIKVENVELKDVSLPEEMKRVIARVDYGDHETGVNDTFIINGETIKLNENPVAVHLRTLETINDLSSDQSNTVIFALPIDVLKSFDTYNKKNEK